MTSTDTSEPTPHVLTTSRFFNRELAELAFIERVLDLAMGSQEPLFERLTYLSISSTILDEFYKIRVAGLRTGLRAESDEKRLSKLTEELVHVDRAADALMAKQHGCWNMLHRALCAVGIHILGEGDVTAIEESWLKAQFQDHLLPDLKPILINDNSSFPFIEDEEIFLAVSLSPQSGREPTYAIVPLPAHVDRFLKTPGDENRFILLEDLVERFLDLVFPSQDVLESGVCHILREGNLRHDDEMSDLLHDVSEAVARRRTADVIRLKVSNGTPNKVASFVAHGCGLIGEEQVVGPAGDEDIIASEFVALDGLLGLGDVLELVDHFAEDGFSHLQYEPYYPNWPQSLKSGDIFAAIRKEDHLLHFPFDSFNIILALLEAAADDEKVISIKQTLYRSGKNSPVIKQLVRAAQNGKAVTALIELEARDDEEANISFARVLEDAGVTVVFGFLDMKVHVKTLLISRKEEGNITNYVNFSTGNYHAGNARRYTDLSLLTVNPKLSRDTISLFNYLTSNTAPDALEELVIAPHSLKDTILGEIDSEIAYAKAGKPAAIWGKLNKLTDKTLIQELYKASDAGVDIRLLVRGACCLRPGVPGLSENIEVRSIVGRFLEHSRLVCFGGGGALPGNDAKVYLSSADWMPHKLDNRVEALVPIGDDALRHRIMSEIFQTYWRDETNTWRLDPAGNYVRHFKDGGFSVQDHWLKRN
jgi:polyphosphate kinase